MDLWQCFDYSDCDSAADSYTFADFNALTWQSTVLVIMTGLGQGSAIGAYREQAQQIPRYEWISPDEHGFARCDGFRLSHLTRHVQPLGFRQKQSDSSDAAGIHSLRTPADAARRQVGNRWIPRHYHRESDCFADVEFVSYFAGGHYSVTPALAEGCVQSFESSGAGRGAPPS